LVARSQLAAGKAAERDGRADCLQLYCNAALIAWTPVAAGDPAALPIYQESLSRLLAVSSRSGSLDPRGKLTLATGCGPRTVPITYYGFAWRPADFCQLLPADDYRARGLLHRYYAPGVGVSLVAVRLTNCEERFFNPRQPFAVTAVLRPAADGPALEFYNPLVCGSFRGAPATLPIDRDITAPLAYLKEKMPHRYLEGFLDPGDVDVKPKLVMMEPYQPHKIPVIFIHGLGSDPLTWADAVNWLRAKADICRDYQFWYYRYPTGGDLLKSATALREEMLAARETWDPKRADPALEQIILVGHSMGGLMAQLQVTYSYDLLWRRAARRPIECVRMPDGRREEWRRMFYFDPSPLVKRVVFIATPHRGAGMADRLVGRAASKLVRYSAADEAEYRGLMDANRDIFTDYLLKGKPTTIDLLEPDNPLLAAMAEMPFGRCVRLHSIIGDRYFTLRGERSDGVVPVSSARLPGVCTERLVSAGHESMNKVDESMAELERILREHAAAQGTPITPGS
jgi:pimeloyl-ACP methyl ester carboxylesterase